MRRARAERHVPRGAGAHVQGMPLVVQVVRDGDGPALQARGRRDARGEEGCAAARAAACRRRMPPLLPPLPCRHATTPISSMSPERALMCTLASVSWLITTSHSGEIRAASLPVRYENLASTPET